MDGFISFLIFLKFPIFFVMLYHGLILFGSILIALGDNRGEVRLEFVKVFTSFLMFITCIAYLVYL